MERTPHAKPRTRSYAVYAKATNEKVGYVKASDRNAARQEAAAQWGGTPTSYFAAAGR